MPTIFHVIERYLDLSAGFVHALITESRYDAAVLSRHAPQNVAAFPVPSLRRVSPVLDAVPWATARDRAVRLAVLRALRREHAVIAHAHFGYALPYATVAATRGGVPLVVSLHGHDLTAWPTTAPWVYPNAVAAVTAAVVPSQWLAARAIALGFPAERVHVIPAGVDTAFFRATPLPQTEAPVVGFVGRLHEKKGVGVLLDAWPAVMRALPSARLVVLGRGPLEARVRGAVASSGGSVALRAPEPSRRREQVRDLLAASSVVVTPSHTAADGDSESLLLVNLEAQSSGRPVVTTDHGGIPEFVRAGETALVTPQGDAGALAAALVRVLTEPALASRLAANGPALAAQYTVAEMSARVDALYDELLASRST